MAIIDISLSEASTVSLLTFGLGIFLGHRLTLWRDRRKEFNQAATPIRRWLIDLAECPSPLQRQPSTIEMDAFLNRLSRRKRAKFQSILEQYHRELDSVSRQNPSTGEVEFGDLSSSKTLVIALLRYAELK